MTILILSFLGLVCILGLTYYIRHFIPLRPKELGFKYVYINEDGSVRELEKDEIDYLKTDFHPSDGGKPYIKSRYGELTSDNKIGGFIKRRRVPKRVKISINTET